MTDAQVLKTLEILFEAAVVNRDRLWPPIEPSPVLKELIAEFRRRIALEDDRL